LKHPDTTNRAPASSPVVDSNERKPPPASPKRNPTHHSRKDAFRKSKLVAKEPAFIEMMERENLS
jgi:hypothetical protein